MGIGCQFWAIDRYYLRAAQPGGEVCSSMTTVKLNETRSSAARPTSLRSEMTPGSLVYKVAKRLDEVLA